MPQFILAMSHSIAALQMMTPPQARNLGTVHLNSTLPQMLVNDLALKQQSIPFSSQLRPYIRAASIEALTYMVVAPRCIPVYPSRERTPIPGPDPLMRDLSTRHGVHFFNEPDPFEFKDCNVPLDQLIYICRSILARFGWDFQRPGNTSVKWNDSVVDPFAAFLEIENVSAIIANRSCNNGWGWLNENFAFILDDSDLRPALDALSVHCGTGIRPGDILHAIDVFLRRSHQLKNASATNAHFAGYSVFDILSGEIHRPPTLLFAQIDRLFHEAFVRSVGDAAALVGALRPLVQAISICGEVNIESAARVLAECEAFRQMKTWVLAAMKAGSNLGAAFAGRALLPDWKQHDYLAVWLDLALVLQCITWQISKPEQFRSICRTPIFFPLSQPTAIRKAPKQISVAA